MPWYWSSIDLLGTINAGLLGLAAATAAATVLTLATMTGQERALLSGDRREFGLRRLRYRFGIIFSCALTLVYAASFIFVVAQADEAGIYGSNVAAWVQAVGSIAAVAGAAAIAGWQARHQQFLIRRGDRKVRIDRLISISSVASHLSGRLATIHAEVSPAPTNLAALLRAARGELLVAANRMSDLFDVGLGGTVVKEWIEAEACLAALAVSLEVAAEVGEPPSAGAASLASLKAEFQQARSHMIKLSGACLGPALMNSMNEEP